MIKPKTWPSDVRMKLTGLCGNIFCWKNEFWFKSNILPKISKWWEMLTPLNDPTKATVSSIFQRYLSSCCIVWMKPSEYVRYTTVNFAFNSISCLLNISFVLFDMTSWNICRWDYMLSKTVFIHSHINLAY